MSVSTSTLGPATPEALLAHGHTHSCCCGSFRVTTAELGGDNSLWFAKPQLFMIRPFLRNFPDHCSEMQALGDETRSYSSPGSKHFAELTHSRSSLNRVKWRRGWSLGCICESVPLTVEGSFPRQHPPHALPVEQGDQLFQFVQD